MKIMYLNTIFMQFLLVVNYMEKNIFSFELRHLRVTTMFVSDTHMYNYQL